MLILQGAPGCGKSSIASHLASTYHTVTVSADSFRAMICPTVDSLDGLSTVRGRNVDRYAMDMCLQAVSNLAEVGATIVIDNQNVLPRNFIPFVDAAAKQDYDIFLYNVQGTMSDEELLERNDKRPDIDKVPKEYILKAAQRSRQRHGWKGVRTIETLEEFTSQLHQPIHNLDSFDKVYVVGDIQGEGRALLSAVRELDADNVAWIFAGDLFDRGRSPHMVVHLLHNLKGKAYFVEGNHDSHARRYLKGIKVPSVAKQTFRDLAANHVKLAKVRAIMDQLVPFVAFTRHGHTGLVTHGGVEIDKVVSWGTKTVVPLAPDLCFIQGANTRQGWQNAQYDYGFDTGKLSISRITQYHGHRSLSTQGSIAPAHKGNVWSLESRVERDGYLSVVDVDAQKLLTFTPQIMNDLESLEYSAFVKKSVLDSGLVAYNFTRAAFHKKVWNKDTVLARGLIVRDGEIIARGYNKFFNNGEHETMAEYLDRASYPVRVTEKENGFLALIARVDDTVRVFSKAGVTAYSKLAETVLDENCPNWKEAVEEFLTTNPGHTLLCEVISNKDPHLVAYPGEGVYLLDIVRNTVRSKFMDSPIVDELATRCGMLRPRSVECWGRAQVWELLAQRANEPIEGFVFRDSDGRMLKYKTDYYRRRKELRSQIGSFLKGAKPWGHYPASGTYTEQQVRDSVVEGVNGPVINIQLLEGKL